MPTVIANQVEHKDSPVTVLTGSVLLKRKQTYVGEASSPKPLGVSSGGPVVCWAPAHDRALGWILPLLYLIEWSLVVLMALPSHPAALSYFTTNMNAQSIRITDLIPKG